MDFLKKLPLLAAFLASVSLNPSQAGAVSTSPPEPYASEIAPLLTSYDTVVKALPAPPQNDAPGWILLDEEVQRVADNGQRVLVHHRIERALTDGGAESLGRETRAYRPSSQSMHLVMARTIQADGTIQNVKPDAMFIQTPQREADASLYGDRAELVIIFPNVKPGSTIEWIVVTDERKPRIPGQFSTTVWMQYGWPMLRQHVLMDLPAQWASRLQTVPVGGGVIDARREQQKDGRVRLIWEQQNVQALHSEQDRAPMRQTGPLVRLTTLKDWNEFLHWYAPLVKRVLVLSPKLKQEVEDLTAKARTPREILDILQARVANDVRYVGLEFGTSDLEPHSVSEVWEHRYGDCKDKAALLCAMLTHKGIKAHLALLNTDHAGIIERRCPDYRDFDHVIAAVDLADGVVFCDPTIAGAPAGMISPADAERDVLLVKEKAQWLRTPPAVTGKFAVDFEARLSASGDLTGWVTMSAEDYLGALWVDAGKKWTRQQLKDRLTSRVRDCFRGGQVVDVEPQPADPEGKFRARGYFVVPSAGALTLTFPLDSEALPDLGDTGHRETNFFLHRNHRTTVSTIELPLGFHADTLPAPLSLKSRFLAADASWTSTGNKLRCLFDFHVKTSLLTPAQCQELAANVSAVNAWLGKQVTVVAGGKGATPAPNDELGEFPVMPSGQGQLDLVNERFPLSGNMKLRRLALERVLELFPADKLTQFNTQVQIAYLDIQEDKSDAALARLRAPLENLRGSVSVADAGLGDYIHGLALIEKHENEALALFKRLANTQDLSPFRRAWSHQQHAALLAKKDKATAIAVIEEGLTLDSGVEGELLTQLAELQYSQSKGTAFQTQLTTWLQKKPAKAAPALTALAALAGQWAADKPEKAGALVKVLQTVGSKDEFGHEFPNTLANAVKLMASGEAYSRIRMKLTGWLREHSGSISSWQVPATVKTADDFNQAIEAERKAESSNGKADHLLHLAVESLVRLEPGVWYGERIWRAATYADYLDRTDNTEEPPAILAALLDLCDELPAGTDAYTDARLLRAQVDSRYDRNAAAGKVLKQLLDDPATPEAYAAAVISRYASNCVAGKRHDEALQVWRTLDRHLSNSLTPGALLRAIFVALETGRQDEAMKFVTLLRRVNDKTIDDSEEAEHVRSFLQFAKDEPAARAWWDASSKWWPKWLEIEKKYDSHLPAGVIVVPVIPNLSDFGSSVGEHGRAGRRKEVLDGMRLLAHAARWQTSMAGEFASMVSYLPQFKLEQGAPQFRQLVIAMHDVGGAAHKDRLLKVWTVAALIDSNLSKRVPALARDFLAHEEQPDGATFAILRLWAMAAVQLNKDLPEVAGHLERLLAGPPSQDQRHRTVSSLATVYQKQGRTDAEKSLLEKELANPVTLEAGDALAPLKRRLEALNDGAAGNHGPADAAKAWLATLKPGWFDYARPSDLKDAKAANPDEAMSPGSNLLPAEAAKLCLLVAADESQPEASRNSAIIQLGWHTSSIATTPAEADAWIAAILKTQSLPRRLRAMSLDAYVRSAFFANDMKSLQARAKDPLLDIFSAEEMPYRQAIRNYATLGPADLDGALRLGRELMEEPLDYFASEIIQRLVRRLAFAGRGSEARTLYEGLGKASFTERLARDKNSIQLQALKAINFARNLNPLQDALLAVYTRHHPLPEKQDRSLPSWRGGVELNLPHDQAIRVRENWIVTGDWPRSDADFFFDLVSELPRSAENDGLRFELLSTALKATSDDATRAGFIMDAASFVDIDDATIRERLATILQSVRSLRDAPLTADALRANDLHIALRTGVTTNSFATLDAISDDGIRSRLRSRVLRSCVTMADKAGTKRLLDRVSADELLSPQNVTLALRAYTLLGMKDEAELARDRAHEALYELVLSAWTQPAGHRAVRTLDIARALREPSLIPDAFSRDMAKRLQNERHSRLFQSADALLHERWEDCARFAAEGRKLFPTFYDFHGLQGIALSHLERKAEAIEALRTYLNYTHNDPEIIEARTLLDRLTKK